MRRGPLLTTFVIIGLLCFVAGMGAAYYRLAPYRLLTRMISGTPLAQPHTPPAYRLWRDSYREAKGQGGVVMLGDSITRLGNWPAIFKRTDIINLGIPGDTTYGMIKRLDDGNISAGSSVFILAGVNDVITSIPIEETIANLDWMVLRLSKRHRVYVQSTIFTDRPGWNGDIARLIEGERALCAGGRCTFIDLNATLAPQGTLPPQHHADGIHLSPLAYAKWGEIVRRYLPPEPSPDTDHKQGDH